MWSNTMATSDSTQEQPAYNIPSSLRVPSGWVSSIRLVVSVALFGTLVAVIPATIALGVIMIAPIAGSVAGTVGLLAVWFAGLGLVVVSPKLAALGVGAIR